LYNPRLKVGSVDEYIDIMNNLKLPDPKMMDVAMPANMQVGLHQDEIARKGWAISAAEAVALRGRSDITIVDLREKSERERQGIPTSIAPYRFWVDTHVPGFPKPAPARDLLWQRKSVKRTSICATHLLRGGWSAP
jgi:hypothetical protein